MMIMKYSRYVADGNKVKDNITGDVTGCLEPCDALKMANQLNMKDDYIDFFKKERESLTRLLKAERKLNKALSDKNNALEELVKLDDM